MAAEYLGMARAVLYLSSTPFTWTCESGVNPGSTRVNVFTWHYGSRVNPGYGNGVNPASQ